MIEYHKMQCNIGDARGHLPRREAQKRPAHAGGLLKLR